MKIRQKKTSRPVDGIKIGAVIALLTTLTGCVGYVDGGYGGGAVVVGGPDLYLFGGGYDRGRDVHGIVTAVRPAAGMAIPAAGMTVADVKNTTYFRN